MSETRVLHIYGQHFWHDEAYIVGNREALTALRDTIDEALANIAGEVQDHLFTNDGEGYGVCVALMEKDLDRLALPYTEDMARDRHEDRLTGADVFYGLMGRKEK